MKTIRQLADTQNAMDAMQMLYTDATLMARWLVEQPDLCTLYHEVRQKLDTARNPRGKFGLTAKDTKSVLPVLVRVKERVEVTVLKWRPQFEALRARGLTWDECVAQFEDDLHGFEHDMDAARRIMGLS